MNTLDWFPSYISSGTYLVSNFANDIHMHQDPRLSGRDRNWKDSENIGWEKGEGGSFRDACVISFFV